MAVGAAAVSAYVRGLDEHLADRFEGYRAHLEGQLLAPPTRRTYAGRVGGYLAWLAELDPVLRRQQDDPFTHGRAPRLHHPRLPHPPRQRTQGQARLGQPHPRRA